MLQAGQGKLDMARKYFETALENDPKFVRPYLQLAVLALQAQKWQELADITEQDGQAGSVRLSRRHSSSTR